MAETVELTLPEPLAQRMRDTAKAEGQTLDELFEDAAETLLETRETLAALREISAWGEQHAERNGFRKSDVLPAVAESRRHREP